MANVNVAYTHLLYGKHEKDHRYDINVNDQSIPNPHMLVVDSRSRHRGNDTYAPVEPNDYTAYFTEFKDVIAVELVKADIPNSGYTLETTNNALRFIDNSTTYDITVPVGNYTSATLATALQSAMNDASAVTYTVSVDSTNNTFTIAGTAAFDLIFVDGTEPGPGADTEKSQNLYRTNSIGPTLGFRALDLESATTYTAQYTFNLRTNKYVILAIEGLERLECQRSAVKGAFCTLMLQDDTSNFNLNANYGDLDNDTYVKYFPEPLPRLNRMRIKFYDMNGNLYNFHGHDHILTFKVSTLNRSAYK